jgi:hypothetical protein
MSIPNSLHGLEAEGPYIKKGVGLEFPKSQPNCKYKMQKHKIAMQ